MECQDKEEISFRTSVLLSCQSFEPASNNGRSEILIKRQHSELEAISTQPSERNNQDSQTSLSTSNSPIKTSDKDQNKQNQKLEINQVQKKQFNFLRSNELLKNKLNLSVESQQVRSTSLSFQIYKTHRKSASQVSIHIHEENECKFCKEADQYNNFIRPCLCKGSMQHVHQQCVQKHIELNYMDEEKRQFLKPLQCDVCKFSYVIKTYKRWNMKQALNDPSRYAKLLWFILSFIIIMASLITILTLSIIKNEELKQHIDYLALIILGLLILLSLKVINLYFIISLITEYKWLILDRDQINVKDKGILTTFQDLNIILETVRTKNSNKIQPDMKI